MPLIIIDSGWEFNTDDLLVAAESTNRDWYQRDMINAFNRYAYHRYKVIRDCVNSRKCKLMTVDKVRHRLYVDDRMQFDSRVTKATKEEITFIVDYADKYLKYVK